MTNSVPKKPKNVQKIFNVLSFSPRINDDINTTTIGAISIMLSAFARGICEIDA